jgi:hypothetical protein
MSMQPTTPGDFLRVALQRLTAAEDIMGTLRLTLEAQYIGGYSVELAKRMRRFDWTTDLRYETGRKDTGETNGLLRTARAIYQWVEAQIA